MDTPTSKRLIYLSIENNQTDLTSQYPENKLFVDCCKHAVIYEKFMPTDRSSVSSWGFTTLDCDRLPDLGRSYDLSFAETTDQRAMDLTHMVEHCDLPVAVYWSGGIDSTVILAAIVKNWPKDLLERVTVKMNPASFFENPWFYKQIILKHNLKIQPRLDSWQNYICLHGSCADQIWIQADIIELDILWPGSSKWHIKIQRDRLAHWIGQKCGIDQANMLIDIVIESSTRAGITLETFEDFYWWLNFNFVYTGQLYKYLDNYATAGSRIDLDLFRKQHLSWYHTDEYQCWSAANRSNGVKIDGTSRSYKWPAKQYIYEVDRNRWYRDYKTKMASPFASNYKNRLQALYDDGTIVI